MRINRLKRAHANLAFYRNNFQFRAPYHLLVDGTFSAVMVKRNADEFQKLLLKYLGDKSILFTTACVIREMEKLGAPLLEATKMAKDFKIHSCPHMEKAVPAADCIRSIIAHRTDSEHFFVATQDRRLVNRLRSIAGCPLLSFKMNALHLEKPTDASRKRSQELIRERLIGKEELEKLAKLKQNELSSPTAEGVKARKQRKVAKGPNPMSCQRKKATTKKGKEADEETNKRKRKRSRQKVSKHIRSLLDQNNVDV